jgi:FkbM family methyltransferase
MGMRTTTSASLIKYTLDGIPLLLPASHPLPVYRRDHPQYSSNVGRIAAALARQNPQFTFIDIGANVGDTLAIVRSQAKFPVLCIEGAAAYLSLLRANAAQFQDVEIEGSFVGIADRTYAAVAPSAGTAQLVVGKQVAEGEPGAVKTKSLATILAGHPRFSRPAMIKIDTDGMDTAIIKQEIALLADLHPVLFFEYDPHLFAAHDRSGFGVFASLLRAKYQSLLVYTNVGDLLCRTHLRDPEMLRDLHEFFSCRGGQQYCDICAFPERMTEMCNAIHASELDFFRDFRSRPGGAHA